ncbi:MAG: ABC transporter permease [Armatimonadota bacterium]
MASFLGVFLQELKTIFSDRRIYIIMLCGPFFYGILFGGVYLNGRVRQVGTVIIDQDHSALSREFINDVRAADSLHIVALSQTESDFAKYVKRGDAYICLVVPHDFEHDIAKGKQVTIAVLTDGSNLLISNVTVKSISVVITTFGTRARMKRLMMGGVPKSSLMSEAAPIQAEFRPLFNPSYNYSAYLLIGLVCIALQQVTMLGASISLSQDNSNERRRQLRQVCKSPFIALLGKASAHAMIMVPLSFGGAYVPFGLFHCPYHGAWSVMLASTAIFVIVQIFAGFGVAGICKRPLLSAQVLLILSVPLFMLTGATWPVCAMPEFLQCLAYAIPLTHFVSITRQASLVGASAALLSQHFVVIAIWIPIALLWAYWAVRRMFLQSFGN